MNDHILRLAILNFFYFSHKFHVSNKQEFENAKQLLSWCWISKFLSFYRVHNFYYLTHLTFSIKLINWSAFVSDTFSIANILFQEGQLYPPWLFRFSETFVDVFYFLIWFIHGSIRKQK